MLGNQCISLSAKLQCELGLVKELYFKVYTHTLFHTSAMEFQH